MGDGSGARHRVRGGRAAWQGGAGSAVMEALQEAGLTLPVLALGLPDEFIEHGDPGKLLAGVGLDAAGIEQSIVKRFGAKLELVRPAALAG